MYNLYFIIQSKLLCHIVKQPYCEKISGDKSSVVCGLNSSLIYVEKKKKKKTVSMGSK